MSVAIAPLPAAERGSALGRLALTELKLFARERLRIVFGVSDRAAAVAEAFNRGLLTPETPGR